VLELSPIEARRLLLRGTGLAAPVHSGAASVLLERRCVQLDPIDRIGTNPDLVMWARVDGLPRGGWSSLMPGVAFEHFAKERCLLPADAFPAYRDQAVETPSWRLTGRLKRLDAGVLSDVLAEITERGPLPASGLSDRGAVEPLDWSGWKSTGRRASMAVSVLSIRCQVVTAGRTAGGHRIYDVPSRALPSVWQAPAPAEGFARWSIKQRATAAGLLPQVMGPWWGMLRDARRAGVPAALVVSGELIEARVTGSHRRYLLSPELVARRGEEPDDDGRLRILGPLDPFLWDRSLIEHIFGFRYVWEVYKPAAKREWGYYVCPLLFRGRLVGRLEGHRGEDGSLVVSSLWRERGWSGGTTRALEAAVARLSALQAKST
jgi:uncharacterized protein YcaQ